MPYASAREEAPYGMEYIVVNGVKKLVPKGMRVNTTGVTSQTESLRVYVGRAIQEIRDYLNQLVAEIQAHISKFQENDRRFEKEIKEIKARLEQIEALSK